MAKNDNVFLNRAERQLENANINLMTYVGASYKGEPNPKHDEIVSLVRRALDAVRNEQWGIDAFKTA